MYIPKFKTFPIVLAATVTFLMPSAQAVLTWNPGDVFLGFRQDSNATKDYLINLGQAGVFRDATAPITLSINLTQFNTDMINRFGANWKTVGNITWGLAGGTQNTPGTGADAITRLIYLSEPSGGTAPGALSNQNGPATDISANVKNYFLNAAANNGSTEGQVANSSYGDPSTGPNAWANRVTVSFGQVNSFGTIEGALNSDLDFYRVPQTTTGQPVTLEGSFNINLTSGQITFTPTPEPSSAMLLATSLVSLVGLRRLRRHRQLA
jgi:hypothetical protein